MTEDLSPEGINRKHGKPVWVCWGCKTDKGLHWYNGWSVAVCQKPECSKAYSDMCQQQIAEQESFDAYCREYYGC
ncbi:hypothetical protein [Curvibacter phage PCA1]|nr:hypothetical protein [Curvibacter phage PCA1]